eukprot:2676636-Rhodomonas_salina.1
MCAQCADVRTSENPCAVFCTSLSCSFSSLALFWGTRLSLSTGYILGILSGEDRFLPEYPGTPGTGTRVPVSTAGKNSNPGYPGTRGVHVCTRVIDLPGCACHSKI